MHPWVMAMRICATFSTTTLVEANTTTEHACCPSWELALVLIFQRRLPFRDKRLQALVPGGTTGIKKDFVSRLRFPTGTKEKEK